MPRQKWMGGILVLVFVLSVVNFKLCISGMKTPLMIPFQMTLRSMTLTVTFALKNY